MQPQGEPPHRGRETVLSLMLTFLFGAGFLAVLNFITFGVIFHVLVAVGGIALVGLLHYLLWGQAMSQDVAGEREEEELRSLQEDDSTHERIRPRRF
ncbi:MAG: hypothetical protein L0Z62_11915 [Gemmataceae bacterium]|nr:hypothetical protein [Gemmataceae bacterium]